jgi:RimJ/RimL family protein N-acetyltransferase
MPLIRTDRLLLEPLTPDHAESMFEVLRDPQIYRHLDYGPPPSVEHLRSLYQRLQAGRSPDGRELWFNWAVSPQGGCPIGYVQATVLGNGSAWVAYVFSPAQWGRGWAGEATRAMIDHLAERRGVRRCMAVAEADNRRSIALLARLGFSPAQGHEPEGAGLTPSERLFILAQ